MGTTTAATFQQLVLLRLNEDANSPAGDLASGTSSTPAIATAATIDSLASEAVVILCRTCWPVIASFAAVPAASTPYLSYAAFQSGSPPVQMWQSMYGNQAWQQGSTGVISPLTLTAEASIANRYPGYATGVGPGAPLYWFRRGGDGIGLFPAAAANAGTLLMQGLAELPGAQTVGPMFPDLPDSLLTTVVLFYVAGMIALKNSEDLTLSAKAPLWLSEFELMRKQLHDRLDIAMRAYFPQFAPVAPVGGMPGGGPVDAAEGS